MTTLPSRSTLDAPSTMPSPPASVAAFLSAEGRSWYGSPSSHRSAGEVGVEYGGGGREGLPDFVVGGERTPAWEEEYNLVLGELKRVKALQSESHVALRVAQEAIAARTVALEATERKIASLRPVLSRLRSSVSRSLEEGREAVRVALAARAEVDNLMDEAVRACGGRSAADAVLPPPSLLRAELRKVALSHRARLRHMAAAVARAIAPLQTRKEDIGVEDVHHHEIGGIQRGEGGVGGGGVLKTRHLPPSLQGVGRGVRRRGDGGGGNGEPYGLGLEYGEGGVDEDDEDDGVRDKEVLTSLIAAGDLEGARAFAKEAAERRWWKEEEKARKEVEEAARAALSPSKTPPTSSPPTQTPASPSPSSSPPLPPSPPPGAPPPGQERVGEEKERVEEREKGVGRSEDKSMEVVEEEEEVEVEEEEVEVEEEEGREEVGYAYRRPLDTPSPSHSSSPSPGSSPAMLGKKEEEVEREVVDPEIVKRVQRVEQMLGTLGIEFSLGPSVSQLQSSQVTVPDIDALAEQAERVLGQLRVSTTPPSTARLPPSLTTPQPTSSTSTSSSPHRSPEEEAKDAAAQAAERAMGEILDRAQREEEEEENWKKEQEKMRSKEVGDGGESGDVAGEDHGEDAVEGGEMEEEEDEEDQGGVGLLEEPLEDAWERGVGDEDDGGAGVLRSEARRLSSFQRAALTRGLGMVSDPIELSASAPSSSSSRMGVAGRKDKSEEGEDWGRLGFSGKDSSGFEYGGGGGSDSEGEFEEIATRGEKKLAAVSHRKETAKTALRDARHEAAADVEEAKRYAAHITEAVERGERIDMVEGSSRKKRGVGEVRSWDFETDRLASPPAPRSRSTSPATTPQSSTPIPITSTAPPRPSSSLSDTVPGGIGLAEALAALGSETERERTASWEWGGEAERRGVLPPQRRSRVKEEEGESGEEVVVPYRIPPSLASVGFARRQQVFYRVVARGQPGRRNTSRPSSSLPPSSSSSHGRDISPRLFRTPTGHSLMVHPKGKSGSAAELGQRIRDVIAQDPEEEERRRDQAAAQALLHEDEDKDAAAAWMDAQDAKVAMEFASSSHHSKSHPSSSSAPTPPPSSSPSSPPPGMGDSVIQKHLHHSHSLPPQHPESPPSTPPTTPPKPPTSSTTSPTPSSSSPSLPPGMGKQKSPSPKPTRPPSPEALEAIRRLHAPSPAMKEKEEQVEEEGDGHGEEDVREATEAAKKAAKIAEEARERVSKRRKRKKEKSSSSSSSTLSPSSSSSSLASPSSRKGRYKISPKEALSLTALTKKKKSSKKRAKAKKEWQELGTSSASPEHE